MPDKRRPPEEVETCRRLMKPVRAWAKKEGYSQRALAEGIGVGDAVMSKWMSGINPPTLYQINLIANLLKIPLGNLVGANPGSPTILEDAEHAAKDAEEIALLKLWRAMEPDARRKMLEFLEASYVSRPNVA